MAGLRRLQNMFRVPDLRNKILFTLFLVWVERAAFAAFLGLPIAAKTQVRAQRDEQAAVNV